MKGLSSVVLLLQAACALAAPSPAAAPVPGGPASVEVLETRRHVEPRGYGTKPKSCHSATNRACWKTGGWNITTDYEYNVPYTGKTRKVSDGRVEGWARGGEGERFADSRAVQVLRHRARQLGWAGRQD
jgi:hypothetical protein